MERGGKMGAIEECMQRKVGKEVGGDWEDKGMVWRGEEGEGESRKGRKNEEL